MGVGAQHCPLGLHALPGVRAAGVVGDCPRGGWPATVARGVWCQPLSLPRPSSSGAGSQGSAACVSRLRSVWAWGPSPGPTACPFAGRCCSLWALRKGVPGRDAFRRCEGRLWSGAHPPPTARLLGVLLGSVTNMPWARVCGCGVLMTLL